MVRFLVYYSVWMLLLAGTVPSVQANQEGGQGSVKTARAKNIQKRTVKRPGSKRGSRASPARNAALKSETGLARVETPPRNSSPAVAAIPRSVVRKKTLVIDARRLQGNKFTETVRYIDDHKEVRFKLQNVTIDPVFIVPLLKDLDDAKVLNRIRDFSFVITSEKNALLNEQVFIAKVLPFLGHTEGLELNCLGVTDTVVRAISQKMPSLGSLSLFGVGITDTGIEYLAKTLSNLEKLHLINSSVTRKGVEMLKGKFSRLTAVGLSGQHLKDEDFILLGQAMPNLQSLALVGQTFRDVRKVSVLLEIMQNLQTLDLSETNATDETVKSIISSVKGLRSLDVSETSITRQGVRDIAENLDLATLRMNSLKNIGDEELRLVSRHQINLKKFYFSGVDFSNYGIMDVIQNLPALLEVTLTPSPQSKWILTDAVACALVYNLQKLQYLHIQPGRLPEEVRRYLVKERPTLHIEYQP